VVRRFGVIPGEAVMVEDVARNLIPARALGMTTVWVETDRPWATGGEKQTVVADHKTKDLAAFLTELTR
jgi:putative hydrolase of the HAD superfamily